MKLVVLGNHSLEKMEGWVRSMFIEVPNKEVVVPALDKPLPPFDESSLGQYLKFVPVKDKDMISFMWPSLPFTKPEYKTQPLKYLVHIFGHEGPNSLLSYLMKQGLALALSTYDDHELNAISTFAIDITLTKKGLENVDHVIAAVFKYAQTVRDAGVQDYIFEELHRVGELSFAFADKEEPFEYVVKLARDMQLFNDEEKMKDILKHYYVVE